MGNDSFIIMDEPEVHLHPQLQVEFARMIVEKIATQKVHFHINTHSPHFIEAIHEYSVLYDVVDNVNYYVTEEVNSKGNFNIIPSGVSNFLAVDYEDVDIVYGHLNNAYDIIDGLSGKIAYDNIKKNKK